MSKPGILVVGPGATQVGGLATFIEILLASDLLNEKYELIHFDTTRGARGRGVASQFRLINILYFIRQSAALIKIGLTRHPAIMHVPLTSFWAFWKDAAFILLAHSLGMKVVAHLHGGVFDRYYRESAPAVKKLIGWMMRRADVIIALSGGWKKFLLEEVRSDLNVEVVPNTVDASFERVLAASELPVKREENLILFLGGIGPRKGVFDILKAAPIVLEKLPAARFIFAGKEEKLGAQAEVDKVCSENGFNGSVQFVGQVVGAAKLELFLRSSIFLLPSYGENLPYALLEAMGAGLPVITTPVGAIPELVEDGVNGYLIQPGNYQALADRILHLLCDQQLRAFMSQANTLSIRTNYLPGVAARHFDRIYSALISGKTGK